MGFEIHFVGTDGQFDFMLKDFQEVATRKWTTIIEELQEPFSEKLSPSCGFSGIHC